MTISTILLLVLLFMVLGTLPTWNYSRNWGFGPSGGLGAVLAVLLVLVLVGRI